MSEALSSLLIRFRREPAARAGWQCPTLVWEAHATAAQGESWEQTRGHQEHAPLAGDPRIFRLEKAGKANNAFAFGITAGRVENNDLVLDDNSISRFHCFFKIDERTHEWSVTDAESKNGTWADGVKLEGNKRAVLHDGSRVRIGDAELKFMLPPSFLAWVDQH